MDYYRVSAALQAVLDASIGLSHAQKQRIAQVSEAVLLARSSQLSWLARRLGHTTAQDSRVQWLRRVLSRPYLHQEFVYGAFVREVLRRSAFPKWHVLMDRTVLTAHQTDLVSISLSFRRRAVPLAWEFIDHGMSGYELQKQLIERCVALLPGQCEVVFHGDNEFGSVALMQYLRHLGWDFIVGQSSNTSYRLYPHQAWHKVGELGATKSKAIYLQDIELTKSHQYGLLNLFGLYKPRFGKKRRKQDILYYATSLPITPALRRLGRRRWGVECQFKDMKSAGWQVQEAHLSHPERREGLVNILNLCYLWATCLGRWLCKTSQRHLVDAKPKRRLSLFRLGWDWLVHQYRIAGTCPDLLTLYQ